MKKSWTEFMHKMAVFMMPNFLKRKMKSCEQTCIEIANGEQPKGLFYKMERLLHLSICYACSTYKNQMRLLEKAFKADQEKRGALASERIELLEKKIITKFSKD
jgi:hypothetical protein